MFILSAYCILCAIAHSSVVKSDDSDFNVSIDLYDGAQVWEVGLRSSKDIVLIRSLINKEEISIWSLTPKRALFLIEMDNKLNVHRQLSSKGLNHTVLILDVQRRVDEQKIRPVAWDKKTLRRGHRMNWRKYPTVEVINEYMEYLTKNYPSVCKLKEIGKSFENTTIQMLTISNGNPQNQGILLVAGSHAREWIAITSALIILREIATKFDEQPKYMQDKDWHVIPLLNPDGFRYTYQRDRFWRKSRGRNVKSNCKGVDLNRNFGTDWHIKGVAEKQPCKELYSGPHPFSEPETRALRSIVEKLKSRLVAMVDFHSFGQLIMFPWSSRSKPTVDHNLLENTSKVMQKAIFEYKNKSYTTGQTYQVIYPASGSLLDWMYSVGIRHSYVIEGRDTGEHGFLVPPVYIQEAGQEMYITVKQLASHLERKTSVRAQHYPWF